MFNVHGVLADNSISLPFLGVNVKPEVADKYAARYADKYVGKPYPNGKGWYPWIAFITMRIEDSADVVCA